MKLTRILATVIMVVLFSSALGAETLYVKSYRLTMLQKPGTGKKLDITLKRGETVEKIATQKHWVKIRKANVEGWVHKLSLSRNAPRQRVSLLAKKADITTHARQRASTFTSAAAARGLLDTSKNILVRREKPDFIALAKMENSVVSAEEGTRFIAEDE